MLAAYFIFLMSENEIVTGFCDMIFRERQSNKVFPTVFFDKYEADLLEITKAGYSYEYEIKVSKSDFKNDSKKTSGYLCTKETNFEKIPQYKIDTLKNGERVNYFYYLVPKNLIKLDEVPEYAGLIYIEFRECSYFSHEKGNYTKLKMFCQTVKVAPKLSKEKFSEKKLLKCLESTYYRFHGLRKKLSEPQNAFLS